MFRILLVSLLVILVIGCPNQEELYPCTCSWQDGGDDAYVTCSNLDNEQDLVKAASSLIGKRYVYSFVIKNSIFPFIPSDAFNGLRFSKLEIKDTSFMALTDTEVAFEGLEDHLAFLLMINCTLMQGWDWTVFKNLKKLAKLDIIHTNLDAIEDLGQINISKVMDINFAHNMISFVHPLAFSSLKNLMQLSLEDNAIRKMQRTMLPNPALELVNLTLSSNEIEQFPSDMFVEMPSLKFLSISNNKLLVLDEKTFEPVWETLEAFSAMNNEIRCDCSLSWILPKKLPDITHAACAQPPEQKGKFITQLSSKDLWCYK